MVESFVLTDLPVQEQQKWLVEVAQYSNFPKLETLVEWYEQGQDHAEFVRTWKLQAAHVWENGYWPMLTESPRWKIRIHAEDLAYAIEVFYLQEDGHEELFNYFFAEHFSDALNKGLELCRITGKLYRLELSWATDEEV